MIPLLAITLLGRPDALMVDHAYHISQSWKDWHGFQRVLEMALAPCSPDHAIIAGHIVTVVLPVTGTINVRMVDQTPNFNIDFPLSGVTIQGTGWALNRSQYSGPVNLSIPVAAGKMLTPWKCD